MSNFYILKVWLKSANKMSDLNLVHDLHQELHCPILLLSRCITQSHVMAVAIYQVIPLSIHHVTSAIPIDLCDLSGQDSAWQF